MEKLPIIAQDYDGAKNGCKVAGQAPVNLGYVCGSGAFPGGPSGGELACQCRRLKRYSFDIWVEKIPWRRAWQLTAVFLPGESPWTGAWSPQDRKESDTTEVT